MGSRLELIEVTFFLKFTAAQVLVFNWIAGSSQVNLLQSDAPFLGLTVCLYILFLKPFLFDYQVSVLILQVTIPKLASSQSEAVSIFCPEILPYRVTDPIWL